jgi:NAD(P)-dependent dehydrogenase (short-subunit alcohol dehydrogenase family)
MHQTVIITGTSSGYGKATARLFLDRGWNVVATMRTPKPDLFGAQNDRLKILPLDVTDSESIRNAIDESIATFGAIDAIVNNAGIGVVGAFEATSMTTVREVFETNTFGVMAMTQAVIPLFCKQRSGVVVNVTSSVTLNPDAARRCLHSEQSSRRGIHRFVGVRAGLFRRAREAR